MGRLFEELKRRNVARVGVAYLVVAWLLLQIADTLTSAMKLPDWVTQFVIVLLVIGFIPAMIFTWVFDVTPDGIVRTSDLDASQPASDESNRKLNYVTIAAVLTAIVILAWTNYVGDPAEPPVTVTDASVAVLPFANMSGHEDNEYFSDGLTETLLHQLAQNPDLRVSARTSSFSFKNKDIDIREIARQLGVAHLLEGSVQRVEDRVRITVQLIRATDGTHLWSAKYDRTLDSVFDIHDEVASSVSAALTNSLLGDGGATIPEGIATQNVEAFDLYLRAMADSRVSSFESNQSAENLLKNALIMDPSFTDAKALLARVYVSLADTGAMDFDVGTAEAVTLYEQVLTEQPGHVGARAFFLIEKVLRALDSGDIGARVAATEHFLQLVNDAPNSVEARMSFALILSHNSEFDEAIKQYRKAISLDPLNPEPHYMLAGTFGRVRQWDSAREHLIRSLEIEPRQPNVVAEFAAINLNSGDAIGYFRQLQKARELDPLDYELPFAIASVLYELELFDEGDRFRSQVIAIAPNSPAAQALMIIRAIRADSEEESLAVARQLLRDDADNRRGAWIRAFRHLMLTAVLRDRTRDELEFVEEYLPAFPNWEDKSIPWKVGLGRAQTLEIWRDLDNEQGVLNRVDLTVQAFAILNLALARVQIVNIDVLLLRGDLEGAIDAALANLFSHSVLDHLNIKDRFVTPLYAEFVADPRIATALQEWDDEFAQAREDVQQYFAAAE